MIVITKLVSVPCCSGFGRYQAVETLSGLRAVIPHQEVAVGLAAIRPLKPRTHNSFVRLSIKSCSGFGRYQAVETLIVHLLRFQKIQLQWVWPLSGR